VSFFPLLQIFLQLANLEVGNRSTTWNASGMKVMQQDDFLFIFLIDWFWKSLAKNSTMFMERLDCDIFKFAT
jgi:hypothetical protein